MKTNLEPTQSNITNLDINGLSGRLLYRDFATGKNRQQLIVYGQHSSIENMSGLVELLAKNGPVALADMPGFGGMDSFYKIGKKPTVDNLADYLAAIIRLRYRNKKITIIGIGLGFSVATKTLQKYPNLAKNVDLIVAYRSTLHNSDYKYGSKKKFLMTAAARFCSIRPISVFIRYGLLNKLALKILLTSINPKQNSKKHFPDQKTSIKKETRLWQINDVATYFYTLHWMLKTNLCDKKVDVPLESIYSKDDPDLDHHLVDQHMRVVFSKYKKTALKINREHLDRFNDINKAKENIPLRVRRKLAR